MGLEGCYIEVDISWLMYFGVLTSVISGFIAIVDSDIKKIVAYRTLSQLGLITSCLGMELYDVTFFHIITHALFKALLFIAAGTLIIINWGFQSLTLIKGFIGPGKASIFIVASLNLFGLPFTSAYISKHTIIRCIVFRRRTNLLVLLLFSLGLILSASYTVRLIFLLILRNKQRPLQLELSSNKITTILSTLAFFSVFIGFSINFIIFHIELEIGSNVVYRFYRLFIASIGLLVSLYLRLNPKKVVPIILSHFVKNLSLIFYKGSISSGERVLILTPHN